MSEQNVPMGQMRTRDPRELEIIECPNAIVDPLEGEENVEAICFVQEPASGRAAQSFAEVCRVVDPGTGTRICAEIPLNGAPDAELRLLARRGQVNEQGVCLPETDCEEVELDDLQATELQEYLQNQEVSAEDFTTQILGTLSAIQETVDLDTRFNPNLRSEQMALALPSELTSQQMEELLIQWISQLQEVAPDATNQTIAEWWNSEIQKNPGRASAQWNVFRDLGLEPSVKTCPANILLQAHSGAIDLNSDYLASCSGFYLSQEGIDPDAEIEQLIAFKENSPTSFEKVLQNLNSPAMLQRIAQEEAMGAIIQTKATARLYELGETPSLEFLNFTDPTELEEGALVDLVEKIQNREQLENIAQSTQSEDILQAVARRGNLLTDETITALLNRESKAINLALAKSAPGKVRDQLREADDVETQIAIVEGSKNLPNVLQEFAVSENWAIRAAVARTADDPVIVAELGRDGNAYVREAVQQRAMEDAAINALLPGNRQTIVDVGPSATRLPNLADADASTIAEIGRRTNDPEVLEELVKTGKLSGRVDQLVQKKLDQVYEDRVAELESDEELLQLAEKTQSDILKLEIVNNLQDPQKALSLLNSIEDPNRYALEEIALTNRARSVQMRARELGNIWDIYDDDAEVRLEAFQRGYYDPTLLPDLLLHEPDRRVQDEIWEIIQNTRDVWGQGFTPRENPRESLYAILELTQENQYFPVVLQKKFGISQSEFRGNVRKVNEFLKMRGSNEEEVAEQWEYVDLLFNSSSSFDDLIDAAKRKSESPDDFTIADALKEIDEISQEGSLFEFLEQQNIPPERFLSPNASAKYLEIQEELEEIEKIFQARISEDERERLIKEKRNLKLNLQRSLSPEERKTLESELQEINQTLGEEGISDERRNDLIKEKLNLKKTLDRSVTPGQRKLLADRLKLVNQKLDTSIDQSKFEELNLKKLELRSTQQQLQQELTDSLADSIAPILQVGMDIQRIGEVDYAEYLAVHDNGNLRYRGANLIENAVSNPLTYELLGDERADVRESIAQKLESNEEVETLLVNFLDGNFPKTISDEQLDRAEGVLAARFIQIQEDAEVWDPFTENQIVDQGSDVAREVLAQNTNHIAIAKKLMAPRFSAEIQDLASMRKQQLERKQQVGASL